MSRLYLLACLAAAACGRPRHDVGSDARSDHDAAIDTNVITGDGATADAMPDATVDAMPDAMVDAMPDAMVDAMPDAMVDAMVMIDATVTADAMVVADAPSGPLTGGPCLSGHAGVTAYRIRWAGNGSGSTAYPVYEKNGLPDHSRDHTGAFGYQIGYTPRWDDPFLGDGGLVLDGSDFVDIELTTAGLASISNATLSIRGRSFNTTASGSFNWQTFEGTGSTPTNFVSNSAPYQWYSADMTSEISAGNSGVLIRIKAGGSSGALIVNRIELCMTAT
ncbi:hypothetical protein BH11MYX3_BH11MYX3_13080 [soil metagenome]